MKEKILIFGNGQIGNAYLKLFTNKGIAAVIAEKTDITNKQAVKKAITDYVPTVVINTAAKTNLEWCQLNRLQAFNINVLGADTVAQICAEKKIYLIHFSSGCIFESKDEYDIKKESDLPAPASYYSWTKVWAEQLLQFNKPKDFKYLILRPRQPVSSMVHHKNMLLKFLTFTRFLDAPNTGTVIEDLMTWTLALLKIKPVGIFNVVNEGWTTPYQIALLLKKYVLPDLPIKKISRKELDKLTPNKRVDSILNIDKLKGLGIKVIPYKERLIEIIQELGRNIKQTDRKYLKQQLEITVEHSQQRTIVNDVWQQLLN